MHVLSGGGLINQQQQQLQTTTTTINPTSPQISPSVPLSFIMPPILPIQQQIIVNESRPETELELLQDNIRTLRLSGWFYDGLTYEESNDLLKDTKIGTFLIRNSSNPRYLFSLSVQTERGPTSVRLYYTNGYFRLDAQQHLQSAMPMFSNVINLIEHYIEQSYLFSKNNPQVWVDSHGKWYSSIIILKPLIKKQQPRSLKHLSRLAVHKAIKSSVPRPRLAFIQPPIHTHLDLPNSLQAYLAEYPHSI